MNEEDQVMRLIASGIALLGLLSSEGIGGNSNAIASQCQRALSMGQIMFDKTKQVGFWPIIKDVS